MPLKRNIISIFLVACLCSIMGFTASGCNDKEDIITSLSPVSVDIRTAHKQYVVPGESQYYWAAVEPVSMGPDKPVFLWKIFHNGNLIEEIVHDSKPVSESQNSKDSTEDYDTEDRESLSWPNYDSIYFTPKDVGTYTLEAILYEYDEYSRDGKDALIVSLDSHTFYCDTIKLSLEATPTQNTREFSFKAKLENPQLVPYGCPLKWEFINAATGQVDSGVTEEVSASDGLFADGLLEIDHTFEKAGIYKVIFTILDYGSNPKSLASSEIEVDVSGELQIIVPSGPLKTGEEIKFTARTDILDVLPETPSYEWDFGDGEGLAVPFTNEVIYVYEKPGTYTVNVQLFENPHEAANLLGFARTEVIIEAGDPDIKEYLQQTTHVSVAVRGASTYYKSDGYSQDTDGVDIIIYSPYATTKWTGNHFTVEYYTPPTDSSAGITLAIDGDVSFENTKVTNLSARMMVDNSVRVAGESHETRINLANVQLKTESSLPVPFDPNQKVKFFAYIEGPEVEDFVTSTFNEHIKPQTSDPDYKMWYDPLYFTNTEIIPYLLVVFKTERIDAYDDPGYGKRDN